MPTTSTAELDRFAARWEGMADYPSAQLSGIVGDRAHEERGGYHIGRKFQPASNYSVVRPDDKPGNGPDDKASAVDMTMSTPDMIKCHTRLRTAWRNNDPRLNFLNAWNGWDGQGDAGRYDVVKHTIGTATDDHKWHIHMEFRRKYVNSRAAMDAVLSVLAGVPGSADDKQEEDMAKEDIAAGVHHYFSEAARAARGEAGGDSAEDRAARGYRVAVDTLFDFAAAAPRSEAAGGDATQRGIDAVNARLDEIVSRLDGVLGQPPQPGAPASGGTAGTR